MGKDFRIVLEGNSGDQDVSDFKDPNHWSRANGTVFMMLVMTLHQKGLPPKVHDVHLRTSENLIQTFYGQIRRLSAAVRIDNCFDPIIEGETFFSEVVPRTNPMFDHVFAERSQPDRLFKPASLFK